MTHLAILLALLLEPATAATTQPSPGSNPIFVAREHIAAGRLAEAERLLRPLVPDPNAPVTSEPAELLEVIRRTRREFSLSPADMLAKLKRSIPDATLGDLERWRERGQLQARVLDDTLFYFRREPVNLFRFSDEARARRTPTTQPAGGFDLVRHLARVVEAAEATGREDVHPVRHRLRYEVVIPADHPRLRAGATVRAWLPFAQEYERQREVRLVSASEDHRETAASGSPHRALYYEHVVEDPNAAVRFWAEIEYVASAYVPKLDPKRVQPYSIETPLYRENTAERPPHITFSPELKAALAEAIEDETNPLLKARRIFEWVCRNVAYASEVEYSIIPAITQKALTARRGDCGVQAMTFITMCRAAGVPARWQSGFATLPSGDDMHDWAEFYVEPWGWLPADPSYGFQESDDERVRWFYFGGLDPYRFIVNHDFGRPFSPPKTSFRSEPTDFQRGEIEIDGHNLYFDEWDYELKVTTVPLVRSSAALEEALDAFVPAALRAGRVPGAVIAVGSRTPDGFTALRRTYGFLRTAPSSAPMREDAIFDLASLTKPIATGTSLMRLVEQGRVALDDPVGKYLPELNTDAKRAITVRHLMTHTSGMPPYLDRAAQDALRAKHGFPCPAAARAAVRGAEPKVAPGSTVIYSCLNAILCAEIVEAVSGRPLAAVASDEVFEPLSMRETLFNPPKLLDERLVPTTRAEHGRGPGGFLLGQVHDPLAALLAGTSGNAGLFSTAADLERFAQMILGGGALEGARVLRPETVKAMLTCHTQGLSNEKGKPDARGLLWDMITDDAEPPGEPAWTWWGHTGYTGTAIYIQPDRGLYVLVLTNRVHPDDRGEVDALRRGVRTLVRDVLGREHTARAAAR